MLVVAAFLILIILIKNPTNTTLGYRLRIFFPKTGNNYNKMTFQFEKTDALQPIIIKKEVTTTVSAWDIQSTIARYNPGAPILSGLPSRANAIQSEVLVGGGRR